MPNPITGAKYDIQNADGAVEEILDRLISFLNSNYELTIQDSGMRIYMNILGIQHLRKLHNNLISETYFSGPPYNYINTPKVRKTLPLKYENLDKTNNHGMFRIPRGYIDSKDDQERCFETHCLLACM